jgi:hypothetical protein
MRFLVFLAFTSVVSFNGSSQSYFSIAVKAQRASFLTVYKIDWGLVYDPVLDYFVPNYHNDTNQLEFYSLGPTLRYGYHHDITDRISLAGELEAHVGLLTIESPNFNAYNSGFYADFSLGARTSYTLKSSSRSNIFLRPGFVFGLDPVDDIYALGINWRLGYEHDFENYLLGLALDGNSFLRDVSYIARQGKYAQLERKMNTIGLVAYVTFSRM